MAIMAAVEGVQGVADSRLVTAATVASEVVAVPHRFLVLAPAAATAATAASAAAAAGARGGQARAV